MIIRPIIELVMCFRECRVQGWKCWYGTRQSRSPRHDTDVFELRKHHEKDALRESPRFAHTVGLLLIEITMLR